MLRDAVVPIDDSYKFKPIEDNFYRPIPADRVAELQAQIEAERKIFSLPRLVDPEALAE